MLEGIIAVTFNILTALEILLGTGFIVLVLLWICDIFYPPYKK